MAYLRQVNLWYNSRMEWQHIALALLGGVGPALLWLWYWTREDTLHPEPRRLLLLTFLAGGAMVALAIPLQRIIRDFYGVPISSEIIFGWALVEECLKFAAAAVAVLWRRAVDEPIDDLIYMLTVALGFSAVENTLFLLSPVIQGQLVEAIINGNFRFFGATLLHLLSSSVVGGALALAFYKPLKKRLQYALGGLILAVLLHTAFNLFILNSADGGVLRVFAFVWLGIVALLLMFEKVKQQKVITRYINKK